MYGSVRTVVWQGSVGDRRPYADLATNPEVISPPRAPLVASVSRRSGHFQSLKRIMRGLDPVQRLNARENAAGSENPTR